MATGPVEVSKLVPGEFFSAIGFKYEEAFSHNPNLIEFVKWLAYDCLPKGASVMDAGCGTGRPVATTLVDAGHSVLGLDASQVMIDHSRKAVPSATLERTDYFTYEMTRQFDAVLHVLSLFHLDREGLNVMAAKWSRWVKPGGVVCIVTIPADDPLVQAGGLNKFMGHTLVAVLLTKAEWEKLLNAHGFEVIKTSSSVFQPPKQFDSDAEVHYYITARRKV